MKGRPYLELPEGAKNFIPLGDWAKSRNYSKTQAFYLMRSEDIIMVNGAQATCSVRQSGVTYHFVNPAAIRRPRERNGTRADKHVKPSPYQHSRSGRHKWSRGPGRPTVCTFCGCGELEVACSTSCAS